MALHPSGARSINAIQSRGVNEKLYDSFITCSERKKCSFEEELWGGFSRILFVRHRPLLPLMRKQAVFSRAYLPQFTSSQCPFKSPQGGYIILINVLGCSRVHFTQWKTLWSIIIERLWDDCCWGLYNVDPLNWCFTSTWYQFSTLPTEISLVQYAAPKPKNLNERNAVMLKEEASEGRDRCISFTIDRSKQYHWSSTIKQTHPEGAVSESRAVWQTTANTSLRWQPKAQQEHTNSSQQTQHKTALLFSCKRQSEGPRKKYIARSPPKRVPPATINYFSSLNQFLVALTQRVPSTSCIHDITQGEEHQRSSVFMISHSSLANFLLGCWLLN